MAKMRVHELAKELDIKSADVIQILGEKGVDVKAASSIEDGNIDFVKNKFKKSATKEAPKAEKSKEEAKPKTIITSKGVVKRGERHKHGEGERRKHRHSEGEHRTHSSEKTKTDVVEKVEPKKEDSKPVEVKKVVEKVSAKPEEKTPAKPQVSEKPVATEKPVEDIKKVETTVNTGKEEVKKQPQQTRKPEGDRRDNRNGNRGGYNNNRDNNGNRGGYNNNRDNNGNRGGYNNNRDNNGNRGGYNNNRDNNGNRGGYNNNRDNNGNRGGYNNNRDNNGNRGGYNNNRDNNGNRGGYNNNRDNNGNRGGYNNNRDNNGNRGGYNNNRDNNGNRGGYNNNRDNNGNRGGYNNNRNNNGNRGGYNNNRSGGYGDRNNTEKTPTETIQNKDRKSRENKLRQDRQERNRKTYDDKRRNNFRKGDFSKPTLSKPKKKEEKKEEIKVIQVPEAITIGQLAERMKMTPSTVIKKLFLEGKMVTVNTEIDFESAEEIALGYEIMCEKEEKVDIIEELLKEDDEDESLMVKRPPVVCVMGHVDHGKTSLLDAIRETNVISGEAGGITQHIGASVVKTKDRTITFLDTPGHEAFTAMRMRGAQSTDIAILVVAADDGVMPQTVEAINHAKAAGIEIIVAINKIDKPGANIERVKQGLAEHELLASDWGGNVEMVPVSAHSKEGIDELLEMVLLQADVLELKANPNREARGIVIESKLDKGKGPVATILVQKGTLKIGSNIAAGANHGKVRAMTDDHGRQIKEATPSTPVEILGLSGVPNAGEVFVSTETANEAKEFANTFVEDSKAKLMENNKFRISLDDLNTQIKAGTLKELNVIIKADVQGSVEAVKQSLVKLSNDEVEVKVIHGGVGAINESDVILASASNAIIIGFNVKPDSQAESAAREEEVDLRLYSVIYNAIDDIEKAMKGMLEPIYEEKVIGHAEIRQVFKASGVGNIAGSYVLDGNMQRGCSARVTREGTQIFEGPVSSLKRFKDDVKEVKAGYECGLVFDDFNEIREGDQVEAYMMVEVPR